MTTINKILFPTDFSGCAQNAFRHALIFADKMNASIHALHVIYPESAPLDVPVVALQPTRQKVETAKEVMKNFIDFCIHKTKTTYTFTRQPAVHTYVEIGTMNNVLNHLAQRENIDMIVMGTKEKHNTFEKLFGSYSSSTVVNAPCHVMIIPETAAVKDPKIIAYATDLTTADPFHIWEAGKILDVFHPVIKCVHVQTSKKEKTELKLQELINFFENRAPALQISFHELEGIDPVPRLNHFIKDSDINLLVMFAPNKSLWEKLFFVSNTRKMTFRTKIPLLVLKEK